MALTLGVSALSCSDSLAPKLGDWELAFRSLSDGSLYLMRADGSERRRIWLAVDDGPMCAAWSPDGSRIAFHKFDANQIFVVGITDGLENQLTSGPELNQCPIWSPDGTRIAFFRGPATAPDGFGLYVMRADGTDVTRLGTLTFMADRGTWSADGQWIAVTRYPDNQIVLVNASTGEQGPTLTSGAGGRAPTWSPDGTMIAFARQDPGSPAIYIMRADGTGVRQLTPDVPGADVADGYPFWTPDGAIITFHRYRPSAVPGLPIATLHLVALDGREVPWPSGQVPEGDLPMWRPVQ